MPSDLPSRRPRTRRRRGLTRWRIAAIIGAAVVVLLLLSARSVASFYVDALWFKSVDRTDVFWGIIRTKLLLTAFCTCLFVAMAYASLAIAERVAPVVRTAGPEEEIVERFRALVGSHLRLLNLGVALIFGLIAGIPAAGHWKDWVLFRNSVGFGVKDPQFGEDVSWYVFRLPFLNFLVGWLFAAVVVVTLLTAVAHYLNGGIRTTGPVPHVTSQVKLHLSILLAVLAILKACQYWLRRYNLTTSTRGFVGGAGYTDVNAQLPAYNLLILISLAAAALFIWNIRQRGWRLPVIGLGLWFVVSIIAGTVYPAVVEKFVVQPSLSKRERPYVQRNIEMTRRAFGIADAVTDLVPVQYGTVSTDEVRASSSALSDVRLLDPKQDAIKQAFTQQERPQSFYKFDDLDVDRYVVDGRLQQLIVAARVVTDRRNLPNRSWEATHLGYTHGHGLVAAPAGTVRSDGLPAYLPQTNSTALGITRPEVYFGDGMPGSYVVVRSSRASGETGPDGDGVQYEGSGGVRVSGFGRRLAFALRFGEYNLFGSGLIEKDSRIIWVRDVRDRVRKVAPFLSLDDDPYPVAADGRIVWVVDAYTTTDRYPYSEEADTSQLDSGSGLRKKFNYVRNSVKAVVDAYEGTVTLYLVDPTDPIAQAWSRMFPSLMKTRDELPMSLRDHLRYPEDLLRVQTAHIGRYQLGEADRFFNADERWCVTQLAPAQQTKDSSATTTVPNPAATPTEAAANTRCNPTPRFIPYYTLFTPPGSASAEFALVRPFAPFSGDDGLQTLRAFAAGTVDAEMRPKLTIYSVQGELPKGPYTVHLQIQSKLGPTFTLEDREGSQILFGDMQLVNVGDGLVYVRPVYVRAQGATAIPTLKYVVVFADDQIASASSLSGALNTMFPEAEIVLGDREPGPSPEGPTSPTTPSEPTTDTVETLLAKASQLFDEADAALKGGDLGLYQQKIAAAREAIREASILVSPTTTTPPASSAPSTTTPPSTAA
jgi:uncharacterized membrane protein (UPF0182 family)